MLRSSTSSSAARATSTSRRTARRRARQQLLRPRRSHLRRASLARPLSMPFVRLADPARTPSSTVRSCPSRWRSSSTRTSPATTSSTRLCTRRRSGCVQALPPLPPRPGGRGPDARSLSLPPFLALAYPPSAVSRTGSTRRHRPSTWRLSVRPLPADAPLPTPRSNLTLSLSPSCSRAAGTSCTRRSSGSAACASSAPRATTAARRSPCTRRRSRASSRTCSKATRSRRFRCARFPSSLSMYFTLHLSSSC